VTDGRDKLAVTEVACIDQVLAVHQVMAEGRGRGKYVTAVKVAG
jgi:hypothetical protein